MQHLPPPSSSQESLPFHLPEPERGLPFVLALGVHLLVFLVAIFSPYLFNQRRKIPEVYTVNLFNVQDIGTARSAMPQQNKMVATPPEVKKVEEKALPKVESPPPPTTTATPPKAISTQPLPVKSKADLDRLRKLKESLTTEQKAKEAEKVAQDRAREAVEALKKSIQAQGNKASTGPVTTAGTQQKGNANGVAGGPRGDIEVSEIYKAYYLELTSQVTAHWRLPQTQTWKDDLQAIVVLKLRHDGKILDIFFEYRSNSLTFNQYAERAVKEAAPFPPFPPGLGQTDGEFAFRFNPRNAQLIKQ